MHTGCGLEFGADSEKMDTKPNTGPDKIKRYESIISNNTLRLSADINQNRNDSTLATKINYSTSNQ